VNGSRRQVAAWAEQYLRGDLSFEGFMNLMPEDPTDATVAELVDLVEHEPKRGGVLGASAAEHDKHVRRIRDLITVLRSS
jgi:hypothetical protein